MTKKSSTPVVFGGTFDPIHAGHVSAIRYLLKRYEHVVIAPAEKNPWKEPTAARFELRLQMIRLVLAAEGLACNEFPADLTGLVLSAHKYTFVEDFIRFFRTLLPGPLRWAVGEDEADSVTRWKNWGSLHLDLEKVPIEVSGHATSVRHGLSAPHPAIVDFIKSHHLYKNS